MNYSELDLCILKTLVSNRKYALEFIGEANSNLFEPSLWNCANVIVTYLKTYKDLPTLRILLDRLPKGNEKLGKHIEDVWNSFEKINYNEQEYKYDLEKIKTRFAEKQILSIKDNLSKFDVGSNNLPKTIADIKKTLGSISNLNNSKSIERKTLKEALPGFSERFNRRKNNPNLDTGIKSGYSFLDISCNGLKPADFLIVAGESGFGKSLFLNNLSLQIWLQGNSPEINMGNKGKNVVYFSLEMPYEDCFNRVLARLAGVPVIKIENASLNKEEFNRVKEALDFIAKYPYNFEIIDVTDVCANDIDLILDDINYPIDVVGVDYLGIMQPNESSNEDDWLKQGKISYELRHIGRKRQIPILSAVQLNRGNGIGLHRLARSGGISTHCTTVIQIESREKEELHQDMIMHIIKQRKGPKLQGTLLKNLSCATLLDIPMQSEDNNNYLINNFDISEDIEDLNF